MTHSCKIINWPRIYARTCARIFSFFDNSGYFIFIMYTKYTSLFIYFKDFFPMAFGIPDERTKSARKMREDLNRVSDLATSFCGESEGFQAVTGDWGHCRCY